MLRIADVSHYSIDAIFKLIVSLSYVAVGEPFGTPTNSIQCKDAYTVLTDLLESLHHGQQTHLLLLRCLLLIERYRSSELQQHKNRRRIKYRRAQMANVVQRLSHYVHSIFSLYTIVPFTPNYHVVYNRFACWSCTQISCRHKKREHNKVIIVRPCWARDNICKINSANKISFHQPVGRVICRCKRRSASKKKLDQQFWLHKTFDKER
jgi:hypothetical protein